MDTFKNREDLKEYFDKAYGFACFDSIAKAGMGFGVAGGSGNVYLNKGGVGKEEMVGTAMLIQASFGFQFGAQIYSEIIFFESEKDFDKFKSGNFEFGADATAVALYASATANVCSTLGASQGIRCGMSPAEQEQKGDLFKSVLAYTDGAAVFTVVTGGLMYEATISGQKFTYTPKE